MSKEIQFPATTALAHFKDWSNYLLITTVAALGWVAEYNTGHRLLNDLAVWCFGASIVFGIFTLALVPLVSQKITDQTNSIYEVGAEFRVFTKECCAYLTQACRPQHLLFVMGVVLYCLSVTGSEQRYLLAKIIGASVIVILIIAILSKPKKPENSSDA